LDLTLLTGKADRLGNAMSRRRTQQQVNVQQLVSTSRLGFALILSADRKNIFAKTAISMILVSEMCTLNDPNMFVR
jgi:hypothetical protein